MSSSERLLQNKIGMKCKLINLGLAIQDQDIDIEPITSPTYSCLPTNEASEKLTQISFKNILWCEYIEDKTHRINYVVPKDKTIELRSSIVSIDDVVSSFVNSSDDYTGQIMKNAYGDSAISPSILVIINPHGGPGKAKSIYEKEIRPVLEAAGVRITVQETKYSTHATDIARELDLEKYDIVACCSGDGIPHEVINGFYQRPDKGVKAFNNVAVTQLPGGSGNALSLSTHGTNDGALAAFSMLKSIQTKIDLMSVTQLDRQGSEVTKLSFLSQCYGSIADADIGTEHLRWMGPIRFDLGVAYKVITKTKYPCDLYVKYATTTKEELASHFRSHSDMNNNSKVITEKDLSLNGPKLTDEPPSDWIQVSTDLTDNLSIFYVGNMPMVSADALFFPAALPNDGTVDMILTDSRTSLMKSAAALLSVEKGKHIEEEDVLHHKIHGYRLVPRLKDTTNHYLSIDGEEFPFTTFQVEVLPGIMTGLLNEGSYVSTTFR